MRTLCLLVLCGSVSSCAVLHHVQVGEIDNRPGRNLSRFEIKISETGFDLKEATELAKVFTGKKTDRALDQVEAIISLFQMGPKTGKPVWFIENYAEDLHNQVRAACPDGYATGLTSIRETRSYPVVSGEIIKVTGYCVSSSGGNRR